MKCRLHQLEKSRKAMVSLPHVERHEDRLTGVNA